MKVWRILLGCSVGFLLNISPSEALPGQTVEEVRTWIQTNPLLPRGRAGSLRVSRSDIPGQRFTFSASKTRPTDARLVVSSDRIRSERIEVLDYENGVTRERLVSTLRSIYGLDLYRDYQAAEVIYDYVNPAGQQDAYRGVLLRGERFGYWIEITERDGVDPVIGQLSIVLVEDLDDLEADLKRE
ncbi:MAG: hypothetical protein J7641_09510 [Cyanobacteria bacterium SID2]|nr:hypothetical protein [Cyanobacteria bacterium SID2]MBP0005666.1 hypothetical protein [Cyanobacteria bacterium SBC]